MGLHKNTTHPHHPKQAARGVFDVSSLFPSHPKNTKHGKE